MQKEKPFCIESHKWVPATRNTHSLGSAPANFNPKWTRQSGEMYLVAWNVKNNDLKQRFESADFQHKSRRPSVAECHWERKLHAGKTRILSRRPSAAECHSDGSSTHIHTSFGFHYGMAERENHDNAFRRSFRRTIL